MSIRVIILTKSKEAIIKEINANSEHYKMNNGLYVLATDSIANYSLESKIGGSEIYFFEGNPNPLSHKGITDKSDTFMNDFILVNALEQTSHSPTLDISRIGEILSNVLGYVMSPANAIMLLFYGAIAYGLITSWLSGGTI